MKRVGLIGLIISILLFVSCKQEVYFNISTKVQPEDGGSIVVTPSSGAVLEGTAVTFKANPNNEYVFTGWSGGLSGTENPKTIVASSDLNVVANFTLKTYRLSLSVEGDGAITERVISTKTDYNSGSVVELTANPAEHWLFDHWEGDLTGSTNPGQITVSSAKSVKAVFVKKMYDLTISVEGEGAVSEKVVGTKSGSYQEGTIVELTATPSTGWSFNHWEGDITSTDNPAQITISSAKTVKAVFTKNKYTYNLKIVGPGVVDEYFIDTKSSYEYGTKILLKAIPSIGAVFKGWSGFISGTEPEVIVDINEDVEIIASFGANIHKYPLPDLYNPSVSLKRFYPEYFTSKVRTYAGNMMTCDYNRDGYPDLITSFTGDQQKAPIRFYLGDENGELTPDPVNDSRIIGLDECRKIIYGEYNADGIVDICIISHGYDAEPWPGDYPLILLSNTDGSYRDVRFPSIVGYYHGGTAGDFDNDGDTDIFFSDSQNEDSVFLINDGKGNFTPDQTIVPNTEGKYTVELFDLDKDGFLDLFMSWPGRVIWGNGKTYADNSVSELPIPAHGCEGYLDFAFYDLNNDGIEEIIVCSTHEYCEWEIQVMELRDRNLVDVTEKYFSANDTHREEDGVIIWLNIETANGLVYLVGRMDGHEKQTRLLFEYREGHFFSCHESEEEPQIYRNGLCVYSDGNDKYSPYVDVGCKEEKYEGSSCMKFSNWPTWNGWAIDYSDWKDFSILEKNGYYLEFAIKNEDPELELGFSFETRLQTEPWYFPSYGYTYRGSEHSCDGSWELIRVPLSTMTCDPEWTGYYWNTIKTINIQPGDCHGKDFYLDEIRIRKVIPE